MATATVEISYELHALLLHNPVADGLLIGLVDHATSASHVARISVLSCIRRGAHGVHRLFQS
jgi:hypothetical protein